MTNKKNIQKNTRAQQKTISIKDVAKAAGVSVATVSNVISQRKFVSSELTERVNITIAELNYKPSRIARRLQGRKSYLIGLMIPDIINPYFAEIVRGVESIALDLGYQVLLCNTDGVIEREKNVLAAFEEERVDGIINVAPRMDEVELLNFYSVPMVLVDRPLINKHPDHGAVHSDNYTGGKQLAQYLFNKGHRSFACLSVPTERIPSIEYRMRGFEDFLIDNDIDQKQIIKLSGELTYDSGYALMNEILANDTRPTAIFACSDIMAWGAVEAVKKAGLRIPEDIAISGFDNIYFSEIIEPNLTTVNQMKYMSGVVAMSMLLDFENIERLGFEMHNNTIILETEIIDRKTT